MRRRHRIDRWRGGRPAVRGALPSLRARADEVIE